MTEQWVAHEERSERDNFFTSIYENGYKGLMIARCNQNGNYPQQVAAILAAANGDYKKPTAWMVRFKGDERWTLTFGDPRFTVAGEAVPDIEAKALYTSPFDAP